MRLFRCHWTQFTCKETDLSFVTMKQKYFSQSTCILFSRKGKWSVLAVWKCVTMSLRILSGSFCFVWPLLPIHCRCRGVCWAWSHSMTHTHSVALLLTRDLSIADL